jgi:hypothetical protein
MSGPFSLRIGGLEFRVAAAAGLEIVEPHPLYGEFTGQGPGGCGATEVPVELELGAPRPDRGWPVVFDSGDRWLAFRDGRDLVLAFRSPTEPDAFWWTARTDPAVSRVAVVCDPEVIEQSPALTRIVNPLHYPLDQLLTMLVLASRGGCIVHAAGAARGGRGVAFVGRSGAGKTTLMSLLDGRGDLRRLSDDRVIVRTGDGGTRLHGTPWAGEGMVASHGDSALAALVFLHHGEQDLLEPIAPSTAVERFLPTVSVPWFDADLMTGCLDTVDRVVRTTPTYDLHFRRDRGVAALVDRLLS